MKTEDIKLEEYVVEKAIYKTQLTKKYKNRTKWEYPDKNKIMSYIPGTVLEIFVNEGDTVEEGQRLFVLEAMKMKNNIVAPHKGKVKKIYIEKGVIVPKNELLLELEA